MNNLLTSALEYAGKGYPVFPCVPGDKKPITTNGFKDATTDAATIEGWWLRDPSANIGIPTGEVSGLVALDFDVKKGQPGQQTYQDMLDKYGMMTTTTITTPSGGWHLLFKHPGEPIKNRTNLLPGLDIRGDGGYIVAAGSETPEGKYVRSGDAAIAPLPEGVKALLLNGQKKTEPEPFDRRSVLDGVPEGSRDDTLYKYVCSLQAKGTTREEAEILVKAAAANCQPPFDETTALEKVARVYTQFEEPKQDVLILKPVCVADWQGKPVPGREWTWNHWLPKATVAGLGGPPGAAKSLLAQQICTFKALGRSFLNADMSIGAALYITCEDDFDELQRRQSHINAALNIDMDDIPDLHLDSWIGQDARLITTEKGLSRTPLFYALDTLMGDLKAEMVFLDLLADMWDGQESDRQQVNQYVKANLAYLAQRHNATLCGLYHPSLTGISTGTGNSGSTAWEGSFRSRLYLAKDEDTDTRTLSRMKANYAATGDENRLVWTDGYLLPESSMQKSELEKREETYVAAFLECLQVCEAKKIPVSPTNSAANYYGKKFPDMWKMLDGRRMKITRRQFEMAYQKAEFDGAVEVIPATKNAGKRLRFVGYAQP